jgi:hypothetical protein
LAACQSARVKIWGGGLTSFTAHRLHRTTKAHPFEKWQTGSTGLKARRQSVHRMALRLSNAHKPEELPGATLNLRNRSTGRLLLDRRNRLVPGVALRAGQCALTERLGVGLFPAAPQVTFRDQVGKARSLMI